MDAHVSRRRARGIHEAPNTLRSPGILRCRRVTDEGKPQVDAMDKHPATPREIIVVCYGNICRSPMGVVLLQRALDERLGEGVVLVTGAGIGADDGRPPSQGTIRAMAARGFDLRSSR